MTIHFLNCFSCSARFPRHWRTGQLCLLIETGDGLLLVDAGLGSCDYQSKPLILRIFEIVTRVKLNPEETALSQVKKLGFDPAQVRHIVLTHLHFDHAGGIVDFPWAKVHVHRREYENFIQGKFQRWLDGGYNYRIIEYDPNFVLYDQAETRWYDFDAIRLSCEPEMYLVPLFGHTLGHCGVAIRISHGWFFLVGDAASFAEDAPDWLVRLVLGPHQQRLRRFDKEHPEVMMAMGHMESSFFDQRKLEI